MFRAVVSGLCVAHVSGTGEHGALMQSQANTEDLDAILLASGDSSDRPRLSKHHAAHASHERSRQKLTELQSNAQMLEQKYRAILHAKVEKAASKTASSNTHMIKRGANEWVPAEDLFDPVDSLLGSMMEKLKEERDANQKLIDDQEQVLRDCNDRRHDDFDLPRYMDYYFYAATMTHICDNFKTCWNAAHADWIVLRDNTKILESTQKLIWKVMKKAKCYVEHIRKNTPTTQDIQECVTLDIPTDILNIEYEEIVQDVCDICDVKSDLGIRETEHAVDDWWNHVRTHRKPDEGIVNSVKIMYEMLAKKGLVDQVKAEQAEVDRANVEVAQCNRQKEADWIAENTDTLRTDMEGARTAHTACRTDEIIHLNAMQAQCAKFRDARSSCDWPYWFDEHGGNGSLVTTITEGQKCHSEIVRTNPISANCDNLQDKFEDEFCEYFSSKNKTCWDHTLCYERETAERAEEVAFVKKREHSLKLQHRMLKINQCFIELMQGAEDAENAQEIETSHMQQCADKVYDLTHLDITYPDAEPKAPCDLSDIQHYPGEDAWEEDEFGSAPDNLKPPFTDEHNSMKAIDSCSFHSTSLLVQKMKVSRSQGRSSMRSP